MLRLWYRQPAADWQTQALALGNGFLGALVFGGVERDRIHLNEKTLWSGGPRPGKTYAYGCTNDDPARVRRDLEALHKTLETHSRHVFGFGPGDYETAGTDTRGRAMDALNPLLGDLTGYGSPVDFLDLCLDFSDPGQVEDYVRALDPVQIGADGQVKEWFQETHFGCGRAEGLEEQPIPLWRQSLGAGKTPHRHLSHLLGLYPGSLITAQTPQWMEAAKVSLRERGLGATGWSRAHKLNLWARTGCRAESFALLQSFLTGGNAGILPNLFCSHGGGRDYQAYPIFQIDGNLGYTAGVQELLLQCRGAVLQLLPTLPAPWSRGEVRGLLAPGGFEVSMAWACGALTRAEVRANLGGPCLLESPAFPPARVLDSRGRTVPFCLSGPHQIKITTEKDKIYGIFL